MKLALSMLAAMVGAACAQTCADLDGDSTEATDAFTCTAGTVNSATISDTSGSAQTCCDIDCVVSANAADACTDACGTLPPTVDIAASGGGAACDAGYECQPEDGACPAGPDCDTEVAACTADSDCSAAMAPDAEGSIQYNALRVSGSIGAAYAACAMPAEACEFDDTRSDKWAVMAACTDDTDCAAAMPAPSTDNDSPTQDVLDATDW